MLLTILDFLRNGRVIHCYVVYKWSLEYNFSTFMTIYIDVVPLLFDGRSGDLLASSHLTFLFFRRCFLLFVLLFNGITIFLGYLFQISPLRRTVVVIFNL